MARTWVLSGGGVEIPINTQTPDSHGDYWFVFDVEGWDAPDLRQRLVDRQAEHGMIVTEQMIGGRLLTLQKGLCIPLGSEQRRWDAMERLAAVSNLVNGAVGVLYGYEGSFSRLVNIQRGAGKPQMVPLADGDVTGYGGTGGAHAWPFSFTSELFAQDPRKYSVTVHGPTALPATIVNAGDFQSKPRLTVTSGGEGTTITLGSQSIILTTAYGAVPSPLTIDLLAQTAVDGSGNNQFQVISGPTQWWALDPGSNSITVSGPGTVTITWQDSWF